VTSLGDVVDAEDLDAPVVKGGGGGEGGGEAVPGLGDAGGGTEKTLAGRAADDGPTESVELGSAGDEHEVLLDRLAETETRVDRNRTGVDACEFRSFSETLLL